MFDRDADWFRKPPPAPPKPSNTSLPTMPAGGMPALPAVPNQGQGPGRPPLMAGMPAAPPAPKPGGWQRSVIPTQASADKSGASAKVVMHHFARSEVRNLTSQSDQLLAKVIAKLRTQPEFANSGDAELREVIRQVTFRMQHSDLTINFEAKGWFAKPNQSKTYQQMYERGATKAAGPDGKESLYIAGNAMNPAAVRDDADTRATFAPSANSPERSGIARFMQTGGLAMTNLKDQAQRSLFSVTNKNFNPKARQNFAALNYARRGEGPAPDYGKSLLILEDRLKINAIYYMGDTFDANGTHATRATYGMIFSLILYADGEVLKGILDSCYRGITNPMKWNGPKQMIEAHIFEEIRFSSDVKAMIFRPEGPRKDHLTWENNAKLFCNMNGIRFIPAMLT